MNVPTRALHHPANVFAAVLVALPVVGYRLRLDAMPPLRASARCLSRCVLQMTVLTLLLAAVAGAQNLLSMREQNWLTGDGLPQDSVHQLLQSSDGFLWIATEAGLARFDGLQFRVFDRRSEPAMLSDDLCCLADGSDGALWVGSADGVLRVSAGGVQRFGHEQGMTSTTVRGLVAMPNSGLLVLTAEGLSELRDGHFSSVAGTPMNVEAMAQAREGAWLVAGGRALHWVKNRVVATAEPTAELGEVTGVAEAAEGSVWLFSNTAVERMGPGARHVWKVGGALPGTRVASLSTDREGRAWVGTNDGATVLTADGRADRVPALRNSTILGMIEDREGNFWFGSESSGLHVLRQLKFHGEPALAGVGVTALVQASDEAVWAGTRRDGVRRLPGGVVGAVVPTLTVAAALTSPVILSLAAGAAGSVWVGTPDGLNAVSATGAVRKITSAGGLPDDFIQALAARADGSVWVGTRRGLAHVEGSRVTVLSRAEGLAGDLVGALLSARDGSLWIATSGGLTQRLRDGALRNFGVGEMRAGVITALAEDGAGKLWLGGQDGSLTWFSGGKMSPVRLTALAAGGPVLGLEALADGWLWVRQERGMARVRLARGNDCAPLEVACGLQVQKFGAADGIASVETVAAGSPALRSMANGELWFATRRGVAIAEATHLPRNDVVPPVVIERVLSDDVPVTPVDGALALKYGGARLTIEYAGLSFTAPAEVRYRFLMEGFDRAWTEAGARRSASYTNLPPGDYRFVVQAANNDGVWNQVGASLALRIVPPFYRRWWFVLALGGALVLLGLAMYRARLRRLQAAFDVRLQERNRIAREIHDTLAQDFVGVTVQLDLVTQMLRRQKIDAALEQVQQTRVLVTDGLAEARRSIWQLRANTTEDDLPARLRTVTERFAGPATVRLALSGAYRKLPPEVEDEVLRIAQEALSNVQRHAAATQVMVSLEYEGAMLVLTVEDDGRGFTPSTHAAGGHYGVQGMRERAAMLGADFEIERMPQSGTRVRLALQIAAAG